jgi:hypothetical protein
LAWTHGTSPWVTVVKLLAHSDNHTSLVTLALVARVHGRGKNVLSPFEHDPCP